MLHIFAPSLVEITSLLSNYQIDCMTSRFFQHFSERTAATQQILLMLYKHPT
jgi:hypothetical protein